MHRLEKNRRVTAALNDLRSLYRKHGFEVVRAAMNRYGATLKERKAALRLLSEAKERLRKLAGKV